MARAHVMRPIIGENGDLLYGAEVLVRESGLSVKLNQPLYAGPTGDAQLPNPHLATNGVIDFWVNTPQRVSVLVKSELNSDILVYLDAAPPPEETARTDSALVIVGQQVPGNVLLAGSTPGEALWGPPPTNSGLTPLVTLVSEAFSLARDPVGWSFMQAATTTRDYSSNVPTGMGLEQSLHSQHTGNAGSLVLLSPGFTLIEPGYVSMWVRPSLASGESVTIAVTDQANAKTVLQTLTESRAWGFYRFPVGAGTYQSISVEFTGAPTFAGSSGHEVWVTGIKAQYGGVVPPHEHTGAGADSVLLGAAASAAGVRAIAVGSAASASGLNSVAVGRQAAATATDATAVGSEAKALSASSVAVGPRATGSLANAGWTAVGADSYVDSVNGTAIGGNAKVYGEGGTAIGSGSHVGGLANGATAVGRGAQALAPGSLALGAGAVVGATHSQSTAVGSGAATSGAGQTVLGSALSPAYSVVVVSHFRALSGVGLGTDETSRLGFFGAEGTVRPVVTGSDGGNLALRNLISALSGLGLITAATTP
ncbi:hypothetical protein ACWD7M_16745 [Streptomyces griseus]